MSDTELLLSISRLKEHGINIPPSNRWLKALVESFISDNPNYYLVDLQKHIYKQYLIADLKDVSHACLPPNAHQLEKKTLQGLYPVQLNYAIDVSLPAYKQILLIRNPERLMNSEESFETDQEPKSQRCLKLSLTDGVSNVIAFENEPIEGLDETVAGQKMIIRGPVDLRKGCIFLNMSQLEVMGGGVQDLLIRNATENVLARQIGLSENPEVDVKPNHFEQRLIPLPQPQRFNSIANTITISTTNSIITVNSLEDSISGVSRFSEEFSPVSIMDNNSLDSFDLFYNSSSTSDYIQPTSSSSTESSTETEPTDSNNSDSVLAFPLSNSPTQAASQINSSYLLDLDQDIFIESEALLRNASNTQVTNEQHSMPNRDVQAFLDEDIDCFTEMDAEVTSQIDKADLNSSLLNENEDILTLISSQVTEQESETEENFTPPNFLHSNKNDSDGTTISTESLEKENGLTQYISPISARAIDLQHNDNNTSQRCLSLSQEITRNYLDEDEDDFIMAVENL